MCKAWRLRALQLSPSRLSGPSLPWGSWEPCKCQRGVNAQSCWTVCRRARKILSLGSFGAEGVWFVREHWQLFSSINVHTDFTTAATTVGPESFLVVNGTGMQYCMNKMSKRKKRFCHQIMLVSSKLQLLPSDRAGESCERPAGVRQLTADQQVDLHSAAWAVCAHSSPSPGLYTVLQDSPSTALDWWYWSPHGLFHDAGFSTLLPALLVALPYINLNPALKQH